MQKKTQSGKRKRTGTSSRPEFQAGGIRYGIDTCTPQLRAMAEGKIKLQALSHGYYPGRTMPPGILPGLTTLGFWDAFGDQDWGLEAHRNEGIEIAFLETGKMLFTVDGHKFPIKSGTITITRPWQMHCLGDPHIGPGRLHWLGLDVGVRRPHQAWTWPSWVVLAHEDLQELTRRLRQNEHPVWHSTPAIAHDFIELATCVQSPGRQIPVSKIIIHLNHLLLNLLEALRRQCREEDPRLASRQHRVELFLQELARDPGQLAEPWTLGRMAEHCGMKSTCFAVYCRQITNQSPITYLKCCRLENAARRLRGEPDGHVTSLALDCGFSSSQYFATCFHRHFGCSPRAYRSEGERVQGSGFRKNQ